MPNTPASTRRGSRVFAAALDTSNTPVILFVVKVTIKYSFGIRQCLRCIHVLPLRVTDFQGTQAPFVRQLPHAIGERTVSILGGRFEPAKKSRAAQEHPGIERVVARDFLADIHDTVPVADIGKEIARYDALDTGMFLCSPALFGRLEAATKDGDCSLSDGMRQLASQRRLRAMEIGEAQWQDVDTPQALAYAEGVFDGFIHHERHVGSLARV